MSETDIIVIALYCVAAFIGGFLGVMAGMR